jgi:hypothetical protein
MSQLLVRTLRGHCRHVRRPQLSRPGMESRSLCHRHCRLHTDRPEVGPDKGVKSCTPGHDWHNFEWTYLEGLATKSIGQTVLPGHGTVVLVRADCVDARVDLGRGTRHKKQEAQGQCVMHSRDANYCRERLKNY